MPFEAQQPQAQQMEMSTTNAPITEQPVCLPSPICILRIRFI